MSDFYAGKTVAVTGGLGLIGSFLCEELLKVGASIILVDDESKGNWRFSGHFRDQVTYRKGSLEDATFAIEALADSDYIFHLASRPYGVGFSQKNNFEMFRFNDLINSNALDAIAHHRPKHALVVSSSCVYSDDSPTPMSDCQPITGEPERVNWGYGWAKRILEQKAVIYQKETQIPITVARPFNIYGERYHWAGENSQALPMLTHRVMSGENPMIVWGSGNQRRNYMHALDCAHVLMRLLENGYFERPINVGREETVSVKDIVTRLARLAGKEIQIVCDRNKPEGRFIKSADSKLLTAALGDDYTWHISLEDGLHRMISWYHHTFEAA